LKNLRQFFFVSPHLCPHFFKPSGVACKVFLRLDAASPVLESLLEAFANFCVQSAARIACNCSWSCWCHEISFPSLPGWVLENKKYVGWHGSLKVVGQLLWPYWLENLHRQSRMNGSIVMVEQPISDAPVLRSFLHLAVGVVHLHRNVGSWFLPEEGICDAHFHSCRMITPYTLQWDELVGPWVQDDCLFQTVALFLEHPKVKCTPRKLETTMHLQFRRGVTCFEQEISRTVSKRTLRLWLNAW
jgi:hypothetical protein